MKILGGGKTGKERLTNLTTNTHATEFEMLHDDEVIPKYAADIVIGRVQGQQPSLEI